MANKAYHIRLLLPGLLLCAGLWLSGCLEDREPTAPVEIERPSTVYIFPLEGTLIWPRIFDVALAFSEPMNVATFPGHFTLRALGETLDSTTQVKGSFEAYGSMVYFRMSAPLQKATRYEAELRGRVRDLHGSSIQVNGEPVLDDTTLIARTWFYTEGDYGGISTSGWSHLYVRDRKEGSVQMWRALDSLVGRAAGFRATEGIALTQDGAFLWVAMTAVDSVAQMDARGGPVLKKLKVPSYPSSMAIRGEMLYVICINAKQIARINTLTGTLEGNMALNFFPGKLAVSADGQTLYTLDQQTRDLVLVRSTDGTEIRRISGAVSQAVLGDLVVQSSTGRLFLCNAKGLNVKAIEQAGTALEIIQTFPAGAEPLQVAFDAHSYYVAAGKSLYRFDAQTGAPLGVLNFASTLKAVEVLPSGEAVYVAYGLSFVVIDARSFTVLRDIPITSSGIEAIVASPIKF